MLHATHIRVRQSGHTLLDDLSMSLIGGELVGVLGASGSGKSTLLRALAGDLPLNQGDIWLAGQPMLEFSLGELAQRRAFLSPDADAGLALRAIDVVLLGRTPHHTSSPTEDDWSIARQALGWMQATHLTSRPYPTLSQGERAQVQWARLLAQVWGRPPKGDCYIFIDSPTSGLDAKQQHRAFEVARRLAHDGAAVAMAMHDLNDAARYCDRLLLLREGHLVAEGTPREVLTPQTVRRVFDMQVRVDEHPTENRPWISAVWD